MSGGFCERRVVMVRGVYGDSEASPVLRWVCLHDETHVWTDSELAEHWATWKAGMSELDGLVRKRGGAETELVPRAARKRPREDPSQQGDNVSPRACAHARRTAHARAPMRSQFSVPLPPEQVSIRMNAVDQFIPNNGYQEGSLQSLAYEAPTATRLQHTSLDGLNALLN